MFKKKRTQESTSRVRFSYIFCFIQKRAKFFLMPTADPETFAEGKYITHSEAMNITAEGNITHSEGMNITIIIQRSLTAEL